jgi:subtilisin inhibitor-like
MIRTMIGLAVAGAALVAPATPAAAVGGGPAARLSSSLTLTYMAQAGFASAVKLTCDPAGGGHPDPAAACAALAAADADMAKLPPGDRMCILLYQPVTAQLKGEWRGRAVEWKHTYGNTCEMHRATGVVFAF